REQLPGAPHLLGAGLQGGCELPTERFEVRRQVHDVMVTSPSTSVKRQCDIASGAVGRARPRGPGRGGMAAGRGRGGVLEWVAPRTSVRGAAEEAGPHGAGSGCRTPRSLLRVAQPRAGRLDDIVAAR